MCFLSQNKFDKSLWVCQWKKKYGKMGNCNCNIAVWWRRWLHRVSPLDLLVHSSSLTLSPCLTPFSQQWRSEFSADAMPWICIIISCATRCFNGCQQSLSEIMRSINSFNRNDIFICDKTMLLQNTSPGYYANGLVVWCCCCWVTMKSGDGLMSACVCVNNRLSKNDTIFMQFLPNSLKPSK